MQNEGNFNVSNIYHELYSYYGDSLIPVTSHILTKTKTSSVSTNYINFSHSQRCRRRVQNYKPSLVGL